MNHATRTFEMDIAGRKLIIETGKLAQAANGSCTVQYGDTKVLATAVMGKTPKEDIDYFPLTIDFEERFYAAGKIKGSRFIKRDGRPSDEAILSDRLIDRSLRPLFNESIRNEIQIVVTALVVDGENDSDFPAAIAAITALTISDIPWDGPIGAINIASVDNELIINPTHEQKNKAQLDIFVSSLRDRILMIEAIGHQVPEETLMKALEQSNEIIPAIIDFIEKIRQEVGRSKITPDTVKLTLEAEAQHALLLPLIKNFADQHLTEVWGIKLKADRDTKLAQMNHDLDEELKTKGIDEIGRGGAGMILEQIIAEHARELVLKNKQRVDGRKLDEIRDISCEVGLLKRTHGSGLFQRGETQVLSVVTLGAPGEEQFIDTMEEFGTKRYMHHYNFPGYSTGEAKPIRMPGRREIGHGALAEKALVPLLPSKEDFPYTVRVVSEVLSSNGSSSQASICGSTLALMDAGVPIKAPVAGIAMGLITNADGSNYAILTDIQGIEDHSGDMDFKVAGTREGITAIQLDVKILGLTLKMCRETLEQARQARLQILEKIQAVISVPRPEISVYAPRILTLKIDPEKIGEVIGKGGETINTIIEECGGRDACKIDIEDDGLVMITCKKLEDGEKALAWVNNLTREIQPGEIFEGVVTRIVKDRNTGSEIGAIVEILPGKDGMVHISEFSNERISTITSIVDVGQKLEVKVIDVDKEKGRLILSHKAVVNGDMGSRNESHDRNSHGDFRKPRFNPGQRRHE